ncbi:MAG: DNA repair protein RecO [Dehalococcoidales bacterium]|nr:DNA repair protein RecO [Dehalococcoidales bacterium]
MPQPRNYETQAIIIKKTKHGEADRILTLLTLQLGKIHAVAKGVRRPKSKLSGHLELLTYTNVSFARGHNLDTITGSQTINAFLPLKSDLNLTSYGLYIAELTDQFTVEHMENAEVFRLLIDTLERLCQVNNKEITLRYFEMQLLNITGYRPELQKCVTCHKSLEPVANYFSAAAGGVLCPDCSQSQTFLYPLSVNALKVLRLLQKSDYETAIKLKLNAQLAGELQEVIRRYIKYILEREVKSVAWLDDLKQMTRSNSA